MFIINICVIRNKESFTNHSKELCTNYFDHISTAIINGFYHPGGSLPRSIKLLREVGRQPSKFMTFILAVHPWTSGNLGLIALILCNYILWDFRFIESFF